MDVNTLMEQVQAMDFEELLSGLKLQGGTMPAQMLIALSVAVLIGLLWCFFGLKLIRVWSAIFGLAIGFGLGVGAAAAFQLDSALVLIIGAVAGLLLAGLSAGLYRVGIFLVAWIVGSGLGAAFLRPQTMEFALVCAGIGLVIALLTLRFAAPVTMILTGLYGAAAAGTGIYAFLPFENQWLRLGITAGLAVLGIMTQFLMESGKRKRKHLERAKRIREQNSTENEVQKARAMMDELDSMPSKESAEEKKSGLKEKRKEKKAVRKQNKKPDKKQNKKQDDKAEGEEEITILDLDE